ncbi:MAG: TonB-dependent receptor [Verrucomicrobiota bacterium JB022]|nr:TonB-dependent receptor [Verrucomicrobiota bacterium JB022]
MQALNYLRPHKLALWTTLGLCCATAGQAAEIRGTVYDDINDLYINGGEVRVLELDRNTFTQRGGQFVLRDIPAGTYTIQASSTGLPHTTQTVTVADAESDVTVNLTITEEQIFELEAFATTGSLVGRAKALDLQRSSQNLTNVVSADAMGQFVDRNAAEALQRQPGITVVDSQGEGKYVVIRGSDPAWNQVMIDGINVATPEENGRTTALNIISTDQLESIEVTKTWTPDQPAGSIGGTVNLVTRSALDRGERFASIEGAYGSYDLTDDDSWRYNLVYGDVFELGKEDRKLGIQISYNQSLDNRGSETLRADGWSSGVRPEVREYPNGFGLNGLRMEDYLIERDRMSFGGKIEFQLNEQHRFYASGSHNRYDDVETMQEVALNTSTGSSVAYRGSLFFNESVATRLGYDLNDPDVQTRLNLPANSAQRKLTFDEAVSLGEIAYNPENHNYDRYIAAGDIQKRFVYRETNDRIDTYQLGGKSELGSVALDYKIYNSEAKKDWTEDSVMLDSPEVSFITQLDPNDGYSPTMVTNNTINPLLDPTFFALNRNSGNIQFNQWDSSDRRKGAELNADWEFDALGLQHTASIGGAMDLRDKSYERNYVRYSDVNTDPIPQLTLQDEYFMGEPNYKFLSNHHVSYDFGPRFDVDKTLNFLHHIPDSITLSQEQNDITYNITDAVLKNYAAEEDISALYLMHNIKFRKWDFLAGVRWEQTDNTFQNSVIQTRDEETNQFISPVLWARRGVDGVSKWVTNKRSYDHVLPALHIRRNIGEDWVTRFSVTKSISRPEFTDLVPLERISVSGSRFGNTLWLPNWDLEPMEATNYDLSIERYLRGVGLFAVNVFYKDLNGVIYQESRSEVPSSDPLVADASLKYISNPGSVNSLTWNTRQQANSGAGKLFGAEFTFDRKFTFLPGPLDGLGMNANMTLVDSEVELLLEERYKDKVPLFKQADQSGNFSLYYEKFGLLVRLSYVWRTEYLEDVQAGDQDIKNLGKVGLSSQAFDVYADDFERIDLLVRYRINHQFNVFVEGINLTDEPLRFYKGDASRLESIRYTGPAWFAGISWRL